MVLPRRKKIVRKPSVLADLPYAKGVCGWPRRPACTLRLPSCTCRMRQWIVANIGKVEEKYRQGTLDTEKMADLKEYERLKKQHDSLLKHINSSNILKLDIEAAYALAHQQAILLPEFLSEAVPAAKETEWIEELQIIFPAFSGTDPKNRAVKESYLDYVTICKLSLDSLEGVKKMAAISEKEKKDDTRTLELGLRAGTHLFNTSPPGDTILSIPEGIALTVKRFDPLFDFIIGAAHASADKHVIVADYEAYLKAALELEGGQYGPRLYSRASSLIMLAIATYMKMDADGVDLTDFESEPAERIVHDFYHLSRFGQANLQISLTQLFDLFGVDKMSITKMSLIAEHLVCMTLALRDMRNWYMTVDEVKAQVVFNMRAVRALLRSHVATFGHSSHVLAKLWSNIALCSTISDSTFSSMVAAARLTTRGRRLKSDLKHPQARDQISLARILHDTPELQSGLEAKNAEMRKYIQMLLTLEEQLNSREDMLEKAQTAGAEEELDHGLARHERDLQVCEATMDGIAKSVKRSIKRVNAVPPIYGPAKQNKSMGKGKGKDKKKTLRPTDVRVRYDKSACDYNVACFYGSEDFDLPEDADLVPSISDAKTIMPDVALKKLSDDVMLPDGIKLSDDVELTDEFGRWSRTFGGSQAVAMMMRCLVNCSEWERARVFFSATILVMLEIESGIQHPFSTLSEVGRVICARMTHYKSGCLPEEQSRECIVIGRELLKERRMSTEADHKDNDDKCSLFPVRTVSFAEILSCEDMDAILQCYYARFDKILGAYRLRKEEEAEKMRTASRPALDAAKAKPTISASKSHVDNRSRSVKSDSPLGHSTTSPTVEVQTQLNDLMKWVADLDLGHDSLNAECID